MFKYYSSKVPGFLNYISSKYLEVAPGDSETEESCLEKKESCKSIYQSCSCW